LGKVEVPSSTVGELVIKHLKELDRIAYIRFASVYREFGDVESFRQEIDSLIHSQETTPPTQLPLIPGAELGTPAPTRRRREKETPVR
jgi:hypothetical protein